MGIKIRLASKFYTSDLHPTDAQLPIAHLCHRGVQDVFQPDTGAGSGVDIFD